MYLCIVEPRDARHSRDKTLPWVDTLPKTRAPSQKNEKTRNKKDRRKENSHQSPFLFSQKCLKMYGMSKENLNADQSANCRLRVPKNCCKNRGDATFVNGTRISPTLVLPVDHIPLKTHKLISSAKITNKRTKCLPSDELLPALTSRLIGPTIHRPRTFTIFRPQFWMISKLLQTSPRRTRPFKRTHLTS